MDNAIQNIDDEFEIHVCQGSTGCTCHQSSSFPSDLYIKYIKWAQIDN